jgi:small GTP-binding protein
MLEFIEIKQECLQHLKKLNELAKSEGLKVTEEKITALLGIISEDKFKVTVVGEFNSGKSTLINAILKSDIIPTAIRETTATINIIEFGEIPGATVYKMNGSVVHLEPTKEALREYTSLADFDPSTVHHIQIKFTLPILKEGVLIIDTPGVNDINEQRVEITYGIMPQSDATLFVFSATAPSKASELAFFKDHVLKNNIPTLFFIVNKTDNIPADRVPIIIADIKNKLASVLNRNEPKIYALSTGLALNGYLTNNENELERSGFAHFENSLMEFLKGSEKTRSKTIGLQYQTVGLIDILIESLSMERDNSGKSLVELTQMKDRLIASKGSMTIKLNDIIDYIDTDQESLADKIATSLFKRQKEFTDQLLLEIDIYKGDLTEFGEVIIPPRIKTSIKNWIDQNIDAISEFQRFSTQNVTQVFSDNFSRKMILGGIQPQYLAVDEGLQPDIKVSMKDELQLRKMVATGGMAVLAGGIALVTGGLLVAIMPTVIGGSIGKNVIGPLFTKKIIEEQKKELSNNVKLALSELYEKMKLEINGNINRYYGEMKLLLQREFESVLLEVESDIQRAITNKSGKESEIATRNAYLKKVLTELNEMRKTVLCNWIDSKTLNS